MEGAGYARRAAGRNNEDLGKRLLKPLARLLSNVDSAATVNRLSSSAHVKDLRLIVAIALIAVVFIFIFGAGLSIESERVSYWDKIAHRRTNWIFLQVGLAALSLFLTFFVPVLAAFGALVAWAYQTGSARLGVVDLFACEISTLCRVATVIETAKRLVERFYEGPGVPAESAGAARAPPTQFASQEDYFPVFQSNSRELQTLEARVVINITAFYTYMKTVRDLLRTLPSVKPLATDLQPASDVQPAPGSWREAARNTVFMLFLALESAREAITDLVEFEPEVAERTITVLISELTAYGFLRSQFTDEHEMRHQRIILREPLYRCVTAELISTVEAASRSRDDQQRAMWEPAVRLLPELRQRRDAALASKGL